MRLGNADGRNGEGPIGDDRGEYIARTSTHPVGAVHLDALETEVVGICGSDQRGVAEKVDFPYATRNTLLPSRSEPINTGT